MLLTRSKGIPPQILIRLRQIFHAQGRYNMALANRLLKFSQLFEQHNIPVIFFKGPVLAASTYGNILLRQNGDLDLLVRNEDFQQAIELIISQGYEQTIQVPWEVHLSSKDRNNIDLDLHWEIIPKHLSCSLGSNYVWSHLKSFKSLHSIWQDLTGELIVSFLFKEKTESSVRAYA